MSEGQGIVLTARGEVLNFDALIDAAHRPINQKQAASELAPKPVRRAPLNVRGFKPAAVEPSAPLDEEAVPAAKPVKEPASSYSGSGTAKSLADLTGIKVDKQRYTKGKADPVTGKVDPNATLNEILSDLAETTKDTTGMKDDKLSA